MTRPAPNPDADALPAAVDVLAARVIALYALAEQDLLAAIARVTAHGMRDQTAEAQLAMLAQMRNVAQRIVTALQLRTGPLARSVITAAGTLGQDAATRAIRRAIAGHPQLAAAYLARVTTAPGSGIAAATAIALDLVDKLDNANLRILRFPDDAYRAAIAEASTRLVLARERLTPVTAQSLAWSELTRAGVTGYTDTRGRRWNLSTYVEMATRSATQRAYNAAHEARMTAVGIDLFTVAGNGHPCPLCKPWEGAVMSNGDTGRMTRPNPATGASVTFTVRGTVDEARALGLFHPNCRHVLVPYLPGVTRLAASSEWTDADQVRYDATQGLRRLEREVRAAKRQQAAALDDLARQRAARRARAVQAQIRAYVARHDLVRRRRREQLDLGNH